MLLRILVLVASGSGPRSASFELHSQSLSFLPFLDLVTIMQLGRLVAFGAYFLACFLWPTVLWEVLFHLLCGGHHKLQAFATGKATPVVAYYDVIRECVIIVNDICTNEAAGHLVFLSLLCLIWCIDQNA